MYLFANRIYKIFRIDIIEKMKEMKMQMQEKKLEEMSKIEIDDVKCIICFNSIRNIILMPCRHICMCNFCHEEMKSQWRIGKKCPICKTNIKSVVEWSFV